MAKVNISIDDVSPHPLSSLKILEKCISLMDVFPEIKFTFFVPIAYWRTMYTGGPDTRTASPLKIDSYKEFCDILKSLPESNFELGYHGFYHGIPNITNNDEFKNLSYSEAKEVFNNMLETVESAGLTNKFKMIFRPPAWKMSPGSIEAAKDVGFEILALSPKENIKKIYAGAEEEFGKVVYYNVNPPFDDLQIYENTEMVFHACEWDRNYLSETYVDQLKQLFEAERENIEFCFMKDF